MPKVAHLTSVHVPTDNRIAHKECAALAAAGYDVVLIAPSASEVALPRCVRLHRLPKPSSRAQRFTRTLAQVYRAALAEKADIHHIHDPELLLIALLLRIRGAKVIYDVHEDYGASILHKPWLPRWLRGPLAFLARGAERIAARAMSSIIAATPTIAAKFAPLPVHIVQNFPRLEELTPRTTTQYASRGPRALYLGVISEDRGASEVLQAAEIVRRSTPFTLMLAGHIQAAPGISAQVRRADYRGVLSRAHVAELLAEVRIGLVTLHPTPNYLPSQPTKLFEYMAAGLPVIASDFPIWRGIVEGSNCGLLVDPLNPQQIADAILLLLSDPARAEAMGEAGRNAVLAHYNWANEERSLLAAYQALAPAPTIAFAPLPKVVCE